MTSATRTRLREILWRHDLYEAEANITSAIRDFLTLTNLAKTDEIVEEKSHQPSVRGTAVDLTALDTFVEIKRRIGTTGGLDPDPANIEQLDGYLEAVGARERSASHGGAD